jgi:hypothetical protein
MNKIFITAIYLLIFSTLSVFPQLGDVVNVYKIDFAPAMDGDISDWPSVFKVGQFTRYENVLLALSDDNAWKGFATDYQCEIYMAHDGEYVYLGWKNTVDDFVLSGTSSTGANSGDNLKICFGSTSDVIYFWNAPIQSGVNPKNMSYPYDVSQAGVHVGTGTSDLPVYELRLTIGEIPRYNFGNPPSINVNFMTEDIDCNNGYGATLKDINCVGFGVNYPSNLTRQDQNGKPWENPLYYPTLRLIDSYPPGYNPDITPPQISNIQVINITTNGCEIRWTTNENSSSTVQYGTTTGYGQSATGAGNTIFHSVTLTGLNDATQYHFRVRSKDTSPRQNEAVSSDNTFTTLAVPDTDPPVISNIQATNITENGCVITWTTDENSSSTVEYGPTTAYGQSSTGTGNTTSHSVTLTGLNDRTQYHYRVRSIDNSPNQNEAISSDDTFTTLTAVSLAPFTRIEFYENVTPNGTDNPVNVIVPGLKVRFKVQVENLFGQSLLALKGKIRENSNYISITDSIATFNNVLHGEKGWSVDEFEILLSDSIPDDEAPVIELHVTDGIFTSELWKSYFTIPLTPFKISTVLIDDDNNPDSRGNDNDTVETGETIEVIPLVKNLTGATFYNAWGMLTTIENEVHIWNEKIGASDTVYNEYRYNVISSVQSPIQPNADMVMPEEDFVFDYNLESTQSLDFYLLFSAYADAPMGITWNVGGILIIWGLPFSIEAKEKIVGGVAIESKKGIKDFTLAAYPNPFNEAAGISYNVPDRYNDRVKILLFNSKGQVVQELVNRAHTGGRYTALIDRRGLASGIYYIKLQAGRYSKIISGLVIK